jgi:hypothetical protein
MSQAQPYLILNTQVLQAPFMPGVCDRKLSATFTKFREATGHNLREVRIVFAVDLREPLLLLFAFGFSSLAVCQLTGTAAELQSRDLPFMPKLHQCFLTTFLIAQMRPPRVIDAVEPVAKHTPAIVGRQ